MYVHVHVRDPNIYSGIGLYVWYLPIVAVGCTSEVTVHCSRSLGIGLTFWPCKESCLVLMEIV